MKNVSDLSVQRRRWSVANALMACVRLGVAFSVLLAGSACLAASLDLARLDLARQKFAEGDYESAASLAENAAQGLLAAGRREEEANARVIAGAGCEQTGRYECAQRNYSAARAAAIAAGWPEAALMEVLVLQVQAKRGELSQALQGTTRWLARAAALKLQPTDLTRFQGKALGVRAYIYAMLGNVEAAFADYDQARRALEVVGDRQAVALLLSVRGGIALQVGWLDEAGRNFAEALKLLADAAREDAGTRRSPAFTESAPLGATRLNLLLGLSAVAFQSGRIEDARRYSADAVRAAASTGRKSVEAQARVVHAEMLQHAGDRAAAVKEIDAAVVATKESEDPATLVEVETALSRLLRLEDTPRAIAAARDAVRRADALASDAQRAWARHALALALRARGDVAEAVVELKQAIGILERSRLAVQSTSPALAMAGLQAIVFDDLVELLADQGDVETAFEYAERARAHFFLRRAAGLVSPGGEGAAVQLASAEIAARQDLAGLERERAALLEGPPDQRSSASLSELGARIRGAQVAYDAVLARIRAEAPVLGVREGLVALSYRELRSRGLLDGVTLVQYYVLRDRILCWVMDRPDIRLFSTPIPHAELVKLLRDFRKAISDRTDGGTAASRLHDILVRPWLDGVKTVELTLVPHRNLHYLPFAALRSGRGTYLIQAHAVSMLPSGSALLLRSGALTENRWRALVLGNPDGTLYSAGVEAKDVAHLLGVAPNLGAEASKALVVQSAGAVDILHVAAHGSYDAQQSMRSSIELARAGEGSGNLEVREIFGLQLRKVHLVTLSACETGMGEVTLGEEVIGFPEAFLAAGTRAVIATLWRVDDRASSQLMTRFYERWRAGSPMAGALQAAQVSFLTTPESQWRSPYYWAGFMLNGRD